MRGAVLPAVIRRPGAHALILVAASGALWAGQARAEEPGRPTAPAALERARAAYSRGAAAYERGDYATAARALAEADALAPDPVTLRAALDAVALADDPVLGAALVERAAERPADAGLAGSLQAARARFAGRTGKVRVTCPGAAKCAATLDGKPVEAGRSTIATVGRHVAGARRDDRGGHDDRGWRDDRGGHDDRGEERAVEVKPGETAEVAFAAPAPAPAPAPLPSAGEPLSPAWFLAGLGATAVAGGITVALAVDTAGRHDAFVGAGCAGPVHGDCAGLAGDGLSAQHRTNALLGVTAALGAATVAIGVLTFRSRGADRAAIALGALHGGATAALRVPLP